MSAQVTEFVCTPNPNAIKCVLDQSLVAAPISARNRDQARAHHLVAALFELDGVTNVYLTPDFLTIGKHPSAKWPVLKRAIQRTLRQAGDRPSDH